MINPDQFVSTSYYTKELSARFKSCEASDHHESWKNIQVLKLLSKAKFPVYLVSFNTRKNEYAMKIFPHQQETTHQYFKNEVRFAVLKNPNVIEFIHSEVEKTTLYKGSLQKVSYILMEYAPYGDFFDLLNRYKDQLNEKLIRTYFRQLINGLIYLHSCRVAHLDLKLENLYLGADFNLKIADFDLSYVRGDETIFSKGTKFYRGPEFFRSGANRPEIKHPFFSDIYSAGIVLFVLMSRGVYPHLENQIIDGLDLVSLMYGDNNEFWRKHCEIQGRRESFFDESFRELFNGMVRENPHERLNLIAIKQSKWFNGPVYSQQELELKMKRIVRS